MLLGVISMFCFEFLRIFGEKLQKSKRENMGKHGLLCRSVGNPCRGVALRHDVGCPRHGVGCPHRGEVGVPKWNPSGTPWHSFATSQRRATPQRSCCSQRANFWIFFPKVLFSYTDSLRALIND